jgi:hypothetical protein
MFIDTSFSGNNRRLAAVSVPPKDECVVYVAPDSDRQDWEEEEKIRLAKLLKVISKLEASSVSYACPTKSAPFPVKPRSGGIGRSQR